MSLQHLDRDGALGLLLPGLIDRAHPAGCDDAGDLIIGDHLRQRRLGNQLLPRILDIRIGEQSLGEVPGLVG